MKRLISLALAAFSLLAVILVPQTAKADNSAAPYIGISPYRQTITIKPGEVYTGSFKVVNVGEVDFKYTISVSPYNVIGTEYTPDFNATGPLSMIKDWVTFSSYSGELAPHTSSDPILYTITVPSEIPSGSQYAAIKDTIVNEDTAESTGINNITSAAMLVYAEVSDGNGYYDGEIIENNVPQFVFSAPLTTSSLVSNTGNLYADASYLLEIYSIFNQDEPAYTNQEDNVSAIILPDTKRFHAQNWFEAPMVGIFKVRQTIKFLDKVSVVEKIVIVCPLWLIFLIIFGLFVIIIWLRARAKSRRESK